MTTEDDTETLEDLVAKHIAILDELEDARERMVDQISAAYQEAKKDGLSTKALRRVVIMRSINEELRKPGDVPAGQYMLELNKLKAERGRRSDENDTDEQESAAAAV